MELILSGFLSEPNGRGGGKGDTLEVSDTSCAARVFGSVVFVVERTDGEMRYERGLMRDVLVISAPTGERRFRFMPSDRWGPFGNQVLDSLSSSQFGGGRKPASRRVVLGTLRELGWLAG